MFERIGSVSERILADIAQAYLAERRSPCWLAEKRCDLRRERARRNVGIDLDHGLIRQLSS